VKILLLDCNDELEKLLLEKGHKVSRGSLGFSNGQRNIPVALYEQNIIIFDPKDASFVQDEEIADKEKFFYFPRIEDLTPEIERNDLKDFFDNGGVCIVFYNSLSSKSKTELAIYNWLIDGLLPDPTNDRDIKKIMFPEDEDYIPFKSLLREFFPKLPVLRKLFKIDEYIYPQPLYKNMRGNNLGVFYRKDDGMIIALPTYEDNNSVVIHILSHVYPRIYEMSPEIPSILDIKKTQIQKDLEKQIGIKEGEIELGSKAIEDLNAKIIEENTRVESIITNDATAKVIIGYLEDMLADKNDIFHEAYKITERLISHYGGEKMVLANLGMGKEMEFIRRISNEGFRDTRHAPKLNEVIKPPTPEENKLILEYSITIVNRYIEKIIEPKNDTP
jgi:hypothetical protein